MDIFPSLQSIFEGYNHGVYRSTSPIAKADNIQQKNSRYMAVPLAYHVRKVRLLINFTICDRDVLSKLGRVNENDMWIHAR